jgi:pyrimidine-nucleoside phosphorylase
MSISKQKDSQPLLSLRRPPVTFFVHGGFDSKTSLVLLPLLASAGLIVPKILWPTQPEGESLVGNLDVIPGMKLTLALDEMRSILESVGGAFVSAPESLKMDHDELVLSVEPEWRSFSSISLLTLKGLNAKSAVFDIKIDGSPPDTDLKKARESVFALKKQAEYLGINASYFLSPAHRPLGQAIGPVPELIEALEILKGRGPHDIKKIVLEQGADLLLLAEHAVNRTEAKSILKSLILNGEAQNKIKDIIQAQGGNPKIVNDYTHLPIPAHQVDIQSSTTGFVARVKISPLRTLKRMLTEIHAGAGLIFRKSAGDAVKEGEVLAHLLYPEPHCSGRLRDAIQRAFVITRRMPEFSPLIAEKIRGNF